MARTNYTFQEAAHPCGTRLCPPAAGFSGRPLPQDYPACGNPVCRTLPGAENQITHPKRVLCLAQPVQRLAGWVLGSKKGSCKNKTLIMEVEQGGRPAVPFRPLPAHSPLHLGRFAEVVPPRQGVSAKRTHGGGGLSGERGGRDCGPPASIPLTSPAVTRRPGTSSRRSKFWSSERADSGARS